MKGNTMFPLVLPLLLFFLGAGVHSNSRITAVNPLTLH